jgi:hypothetical protein
MPSLACGCRDVRGSVRHVFRQLGSGIALAALTAGLAGCGFIGASRVSHAKPDGFSLHGHVAVPVAANDARPDGAACASLVPGVVGGTRVAVSDPAGHELATGVLGDGVIARTGTGASCDFPFQITAVPGGVDSYDVAVAGHVQRFPAKELREGASAVLTVTG